MRVDLAYQAECDVSSRCGLAMACLRGRCGPCALDRECAAQEACAVQHCVPEAHVGCRSRLDCATGEVCMLTGLTPDPRNNAGLFAYCSGSKSPVGRDMEAEAAHHRAEYEAKAPDNRSPAELGESSQLADELRRALEEENGTNLGQAP
jgi:hypothetical protein